MSTQTHTPKPQRPPRTPNTGNRKPYNVRLDVNLVRDAMEAPDTGDLSLAGLIERLIAAYVERP